MCIIYDRGPCPPITTCKLPTRRSPRNHASTYVEPYLIQYRKRKGKIKEDDWVEFVNKEDRFFGKSGRVLATKRNRVCVEVFRITIRQGNLIWRPVKDLQITELCAFFQKVTPLIGEEDCHRLAGESDSTDKSYRSDSSLDLGDSDSSVDEFYWSDDSIKMLGKEYV